jgi:ribonucleoside-diphosphate reductase alpha chain
MMEVVRTYNLDWCHHNQSVTINVRPEEWEEVGRWVFDHFDHVVGMTFLPESDHTYQQAPYERIDQREYERLLDEMPDSIEWEMLASFEQSDHTEGAKELACVSGACEVA